MAVRLALLVLAAAIAVPIALAIAGGDDDGGPSLALDKQLERVAGAPAPLRALHAQASRLLEGDVETFEARLAALRGRPVVVNKWASWCGPCRFEFPFFQEQAAAFGKDVAFLGLNSGDSRDGARKFLSEFPLSYPSYVDPDEKIARAIGAPANYPITVFYDETGKRELVHQGGYDSARELASDIRRYALGT